MVRNLVFAFSTLLVFCSSLAFAHHSRFGVFDTDRTIALEGIVTELRWNNPHVHFELEVTDADGGTQRWGVETTAISMLRSRGINREFFHLGDTVTVAGHPNNSGSSDLLGMNLLLTDGTEVVLGITGKPYFTAGEDGQLLESIFDLEAAEQARANAEGIYRVWSTILTDPDSFPMFKGRYPLNEVSAQIKASWNPDPEQQLSCWAKAMPNLMVTPHPIEFSQQGENILMRFEEDDAERLIHMNAGDQSQPTNATSMGYSTGSWDNGTLVVETINIDAEAFDDVGTPIGKDLHMVERYTLSEDEQRLDYKVTFTDPEIFTEPFDLTRYMVWRPERAVQPWDCEN